MQKEVFGAERDEVAGEWRKLHNGELQDLYCALNIISLIKLWRRGWAGHVAYSREKRNAYGIRLEKWNKQTTWKTQA